MKQVVQDVPLDVQHAIMELWVLRGRKEVEATALHLKIVIQPCGLLKGVHPEKVRCQEVHRSLLVDFADGSKGLCASRLSHEGAVNINAANIARSNGHRIADFAGKDKVAGSQFVIGLSGFVILFLQLAHGRLGKADAVRRVGQRVVGKVKQHDPGVDGFPGGAHVICVVSENQRGFRGTGKDLCKTSLFCGRFTGRRRVSKFNRPFVVRSRGRDAILALVRPVRREVDGRIIHHGGHQTCRCGHGLIVDVLWGVQIAGLHIMIQAKRVSNFVENEVIDRMFHQVRFLQLGCTESFHRLEAEEKLLLQSRSHGTETGVRRLLEIFERQCGHAEQPFAQDPVRNERIFEHDIGADDLTGAWIGEARSVPSKRRTGRGCPAEYVIPDIPRVPIRVVRLFFHLDCVAEAGGFKGLIPGKRGILDGLAEFLRGCVLDPPDNRFDRFGHCRIRVLFLQVPAVDRVTVRRC